MLNWSALVAILSFSSIMGSPDKLEELGQHVHDECVRQTGVDESIIVAANNKGGFADDEKFKCYIKCAYGALSVIDDNGEVDQDALIALMPHNIKDKAEAIIRPCKTKKVADACDTIYQASKCYYDADPDTYFLV